MGHPNNQSQRAQQWTGEGFVVVRSLFDSEVCQSLLETCERCLQQWRQKSPETGEARVDAIAMRHLNHPEYHRHRRSGLVTILEAAADPAVLDLGRSILGEEILFRCTSLFMNPDETGNDGHWHRDSQFLYPDLEEEERVVSRLADAGNSFQLAGGAGAIRRRRGGAGVSSALGHPG